MVSPNLIRNAAHYFRTDEARIKKFIRDFFAANEDIDAETYVMDEFLDEVIKNATPAELDDFCSYISLRKEEVENLINTKENLK